MGCTVFLFALWKVKQVKMRKILFYCLFLFLPAKTVISQEIFGSKITSPGSRRKRNTLVNLLDNSRNFLRKGDIKEKKISLL